MKTQTGKTDEFSEGPFIDATAYYDTRGAARVLGQSETQLRQWRHRKTGPRFSQADERCRVKYLGAWLIEFRRGMIVDPAEGVRS